MSRLVEVVVHVAVPAGVGDGQLMVRLLIEKRERMG